MITIPIDAITIGDRDRSDMGDLDALAGSIKAIGLLHPVVVTASNALVAGGRRLAAVRKLGWTDVPVTVVDITTVHDALRAEADENTCRKSLTPYEASLARQRRATVLAEDAARRKVEAGKNHGRGIASSNLDEAIDPKPAPTARATRKVGAVGTGYSGTTLDKVDKVREVAERGTVTRHGAQATVPEPVREVARAAVTELKTPGGNPSKAIRDVEKALDGYLATAPGMQRVQAEAAISKAISKSSAALAAINLREIDPEIDPEIRSEIRDHVEFVTRWAATLPAPSSTLRVIAGGNR